MFTYKIDDDYELRLLEPRYAQMVFNAVERNRDYLSKWLPWVPQTTSPDDVTAFIQSQLNRFAKNNGFTAGIFYKNDYIGNIGIQEIDWEHKKTSIGYWMSADHQGKGIMTLACKEMVHYAFQTLNLNRVEIRARTDNYRSRAIPERLGFTQEGILRQVELNNIEYYDHVLYSMVASEWEY